MTEVPGPNIETSQPKPSEHTLVLSGIERAVNGLRRWRAERLSTQIGHHQDEIDDISDVSFDVNKATGAYALETGPDFFIKFPVAKGGERSLAAAKAIDELHKGPLRPATRTEIGVVRKTDRKLRANARRAGYIQDLYAIYDRFEEPQEKPTLPDRRTGEVTGSQEESDQRAEIESMLRRVGINPEPRPKIGNVELRKENDEALRRAGLLRDQPAQPGREGIHVGTDEHRELVKNQRISKREKRNTQRADRLVNDLNTGRSLRSLEFSNIFKRVGYVESVATGRDKSVRKLEKKQDKLQRKIDRKTHKLQRLNNR